VNREGLLFSWNFLELERIRRRKTSFSEVRPFFGPFCSKSAKLWPQICPAAPLFIWHFLSYAAEQSAGWQHCIPDFLGNCMSLE